MPSPASDPRFALQVDFDYVVDHYLALRRDPRPFTFLQVGALDGMFCDPIYERVLKDGWHGILVEPQPAYFKRLVENYSGVDGLTFLNSAVSDHEGTATMYVVADAAGTPIEAVGLGGLATFRQERLERAFRGRLGARVPGGRVGSIEVGCTTFPTILADAAYLDLLQIDAEGYDLELIRLFDFERFSPPIVRFEHRLLSTHEVDEAVLLLARHGYRVLREEEDMTAYRQPARGRAH